MVIVSEMTNHCTALQEMGKGMIERPLSICEHHVLTCALYYILSQFQNKKKH